MEFHVTPVDDLIEHEEDEDCVCGPECNFSEGIIIVHHALDGRE